MPVNYQDIQIQIRQMGREALPRERNLQERLEKAKGTLYQYAVELEEIRQRVDQATALNSGLRLAVPVSEALTSHIDPPGLNCAYTLLAADGSQVIPSHHDAVEFGVINVGAIRLLPGQSHRPEEIVESELLFYDSLYNSDGYPLTEEVVALMRDVSERRTLAEYAARETLPTVALTDGQLEVFGESKTSREYEHWLDQYMLALQRLSELQVVAAGYVAKPYSDLVVRLLELMLLEPSELKQAGKPGQLKGLRDHLLFSYLLGPGQRSAIFAIQSKSSARFEGPLALHFFYINVSQNQAPHLARVEIPAWVADNAALVDLLHFALVSQCGLMGSRPYPYALHRAHEVAVVSLDEKRQLENMIMLELRRQGIDVNEISDKQFHKELAPRMRFR